MEGYKISLNISDGEKLVVKNILAKRESEWKASDNDLKFVYRTLRSVPTFHKNILHQISLWIPASSPPF